MIADAAMEPIPEAGRLWSTDDAGNTAIERPAAS